MPQLLYSQGKRSMYLKGEGHNEPPEPFGTLQRREKSLVPARNETMILHGLVTVSCTLSPH